MLLVDTNVILAAADVSAVEHDRCARLLDEHRDLTITAAVAVESAWMIESRLGPRAEAAFVAALAAGEMRVVDLTAADWRRCAELIERYHDLGLGVVDASIVAVAERLGASTIATLNHRDFAVVRPVTRGIWLVRRVRSRAAGSVRRRRTLACTGRWRRSRWSGCCRGVTRRPVRRSGWR